MLKNYLINGYQFQFEEGEQPAGAVELRAGQVEPPARAEALEKKEAPKPANKVRKAANK